MTKAEYKRIEKAIDRHEYLRNRIKAVSAEEFDNYTETQLRSFDQWYGECYGIELVLNSLGIKVENIDFTDTFHT